ncbi:hypothetical protein AVEN_141675-1 [Araneus ventricosus]|uniref:Uncharacterized protein n=1 Tax=Araneus ventricosus TaxID=182803 RepID=A0A4Y2W154_ARAVE|nr:hypothetical protein AVEN_141675-1 [Araneus ventricosus]
MCWHLHFKHYCLQLLQHPTPDDYARRFGFCSRKQQAMEHDDDLAGTLIFSDEATIHLSEKVNHHNVRVWGTELSHVIVEKEKDSPKVNVFYAISKAKLYGSFFFIEQAATGSVYLDMLQLWLFPQPTSRLSFFNRAAFHLTRAQLSATFPTENCHIVGSVCWSG